MEIKTSESYKKAVLEKYEKAKEGEMSIYFTKPTTKLIRQACIWLLDKRNAPNDNYILNCFFGFNDGENKLNKVQKIDESKFKPIVHFLKGKVKKPSAKNIELISWLVDFKPRPLQEYLKLDANIKEGNDEVINTETDNNVETSRNKINKFGI